MKKKICRAYIFLRLSSFAQSSARMANCTLQKRYCYLMMNSNSWTAEVGPKEIYILPQASARRGTYSIYPTRRAGCGEGDMYAALTTTQECSLSREAISVNDTPTYAKRVEPWPFGHELGPLTTVQTANSTPYPQIKWTSSTLISSIPSFVFPILNNSLNLDFF